MCHDPDIITKLAASIAPKLKGQDDIKAAIACLLFGGSRKVRVCVDDCVFMWLVGGWCGARRASLTDCQHNLPRTCLLLLLLARVLSRANNTTNRSCLTARRGVATSTSCCWATPRSASHSSSSLSARSVGVVMGLYGYGEV
jgi:hypothetical protein